MRGVLRIIAVGACATALSAPGTPAFGAQTLGLASGGVACETHYAYVQRAGGPSYTAASSGVITSWSAVGDATANRRLSPLVLRPVPGMPGTFASIAEDGPFVLRTPGVVNKRLGRHVPIQAGDVIGRYSTTSTDCAGASGVFSDSVGQNAASGNPPFGAALAYDPYLAGATVNISAVVEPDSDADTWGDESQDMCLGAAGTRAFAGCPRELRVGKPRLEGKRRLKIPLILPGAGGVSAEPMKPGGRVYTQKPPFFGVSEIVSNRSRHRVGLTLTLRSYVPKQVEKQGNLKLQVRVTFSPLNQPIRRWLTFVLRD